MRHRHTLTNALRILAAIVLILVATKALILTWHGYTLLRNGWALKSLADDPLLVLDGKISAQVPINLREIARSLRGLERELRPVFSAGWLPRGALRDNLNAGQQLLAIAAQAATAGSEAARALPGMAAAASGHRTAPRDAQQPGMSEVLFEGLLGGREHLSKAAELLDSAVPMVEGLPSSGLWSPLARASSLTTKYLPLGPVALRAAVSLPALLGEAGPVNYLILAQNNDEIRATGGFVTGIGLVTLHRGKIEQITIRDSYDFDKFTVDHPFAPDPMQQHMGIILWTTRDGNWSPDFPTAARETVELFNLENPEPISGTVAFDMFALPPLVEAVGPLHLPDLGEPITGQTVLDLLRESWGPEVPEGMTWDEWRKRAGRDGVSEWWEHRKDMIGLLAKALLSRLQGQGDFSNLGALLQAVMRIQRERHLMVNVGTPEVQKLVRALGLDGAVRDEGASDYLLALDTNMGYNKVNYYVTRSLDYEVTLADEDAPRSRLTINWHNPTPALDVCNQRPKFAVSYDDMARGCYWNFVRVYVPEESRFLGASGFTETVTSHVELDKLVISSFLLVPAAERRTVQLEYQLPPLDEDEYRLLVQKQPGSDAVPLRVTVILPLGAELVFASPQPSAVEGRQVQFATNIREDRTLVVRWQ